jgi:hypothetical protein
MIVRETLIATVSETVLLVVDIVCADIEWMVR